MRPSLDVLNQEAKTRGEHLPRVVLAEDDEGLRELLAETLRRDGYEVFEAGSGYELLEVLAERSAPPDGGEPGCELVITDIRMPWASGLKVLETLRRRGWSTPLMVITAFGDKETHAEARRIGVAAVFDKPFDLDDFRTAVCNLLPPAR